MMVRSMSEVPLTNERDDLDTANDGNGVDDD